MNIWLWYIYTLTFYTHFLIVTVTVIALQQQTFALRFSTAEVAAEFKKAFLDGQEEMGRLLKGEDAKEGGSEAAQLADAVEALTVKVWFILLFITTSENIWFIRYCIIHEIILTIYLYMW